MLLDNSLAVVEYFHNSVGIIIDSPLSDGLFGPLLHHFGAIKGGELRIFIWRLVTNCMNPHLILEIWIKGTTTPSEIRRRAKEDYGLQKRRLEYNSSIIMETIHPHVADDQDCPIGSRAFQPFLNSQSPNLYAIVSTKKYDPHAHLFQV